MKKLPLAGIAAVAFFGAPAFAADPAAVVATNWTGLYLDADIGWGQSRFNWLYSNFPGEITFPLSSSGGVLGGHIGYQQQFGWLVVGGEFGASSLMNSKFASVTSVGIFGAPCGTRIAGQQCQALLGNIITGGGKAGVAWQDWLIYGVGGGAWGSVQTQLLARTGTTLDTTNGEKRSGYYAGGGVDYVLSKTRLVDFIIGAEYEHINLGSRLLLSSADGFSPTGTNARTVSAQEDIVWGKLTVKFNPLAP